MDRGIEATASKLNSGTCCCDLRNSNKAINDTGSRTELHEGVHPSTSRGR